MNLPGQHRGGASCRLTLSRGAASLTPTKKVIEVIAICVSILKAAFRDYKLH